MSEDEIVERDPGRWTRGAAPSVGRVLLAGYVMVAVLFVGFGGWASVAPLASAAVAPGRIKTEGNRRTVQHLEGGIVRAILVREGERVAAGQTLLRLDPTQSNAATGMLRSQFASLAARDSRLSAERDRATSIHWAEYLVQNSDDAEVLNAITTQQSLFDTRARAYAGQREILARRIEQLGSEIESYRAQIRSQRDQLVLIEEEIASVQTLVDKGLERRPRLLGLQRQKAYLEGNRDQLAGQVAKSRQAIGETELQITQLEKDRDSEIATEQSEVRQNLSEVEERLRAGDFVLERHEITAPVAGRVVQLRFFTKGGVIRAGEPILEIVAEGERMIIESMVNPIDIDVVYPGLTAEVRLSAFHQRYLPMIHGTVENVSADAIVEERSGASYYKADIVVNPEELARLEDVVLVPGMPAEVLILTGERTALDYVTKPITKSFNRAFRED